MSTQIKYLSSQELSSIMDSACLLNSYHVRNDDLFSTIRGFESPHLGIFLLVKISLKILVNSILDYIVILVSLLTKFPLTYFKSKPTRKDRGKTVAIGMRVMNPSLINPKLISLFASILVSSTLFDEQQFYVLPLAIMETILKTEDRSILAKACELLRLIISFNIEKLSLVLGSSRMALRSQIMLLMLKSSIRLIIQLQTFLFFGDIRGRIFSSRPKSVIFYSRSQQRALQAASSKTDISTSHILGTSLFINF